MSTADAPLARLCSRQICRRPAQATLTYVYADSTAVIGPLSVHAEPHAYDLCTPHASRLTPPRGWEIVRLETAPPLGDTAHPSPVPGQTAGPLTRAAEPGPGAPGHARRRGLADLSAEPRTTGPASAQTDERQPDAHPDAHPVEDLPGRDRPVGDRPVEDPRAEDRPGPVALDGRSGRARRLTAVPSTAPTGSTATGSAEAAADGSSVGEPAREDSADTLTDEIFAGEGTDVVDSRRRLAAQPEGMRRPHLRRGRRPRTGA